MNWVKLAALSSLCAIGLYVIILLRRNNQLLRQMQTSNKTSFQQLLELLRKTWGVFGYYKLSM